ncbi:MAG: LacI family DNA-binding transcriptional regulator [bacterium]|jgi:DNA-binding LacI/PurR family transcriptional regulator
MRSKTVQIDRPTLHKVAEVSGFAISTVSMVLSGKADDVGIRPATQLKIMQVAEELGYVPHKKAKDLFSGKSDSIGLIIHILAPFILPLVRELIQEAHNNNLGITPYITNGDPALEEHYLNLMRDGRVDAAITLASIDGSIERYRKYSNPPYNLKLLHYGGTLHSELHSISHNSIEVGRLAARHLIDIGCRSFGFLGGYNELPAVKGFIDYLRACNQAEPQVVFSKVPLPNIEQEVELARRFIRAGGIPEGVLAYNDSQAAILLAELSRMGIRVPDDMAVIGCDNIEICRCTYPQLSSIDLNNALIAKTAIKMIRKIIDGSINEIVQVEVPISLVTRESTRR